MSFFGGVWHLVSLVAREATQGWKLTSLIVSGLVKDSVMSGMPDCCSGFRGQGARVQGFRVQGWVQASLECFEAKVRHPQRLRERESVIQGFLANKNPPPAGPYGSPMPRDL